MGLVGCALVVQCWLGLGCLWCSSFGYVGFADCCVLGVGFVIAVWMICVADCLGLVCFVVRCRLIGFRIC